MSPRNRQRIVLLRVQESNSPPAQLGMIRDHLALWAQLLKGVN